MHFSKNYCGKITTEAPLPHLIIQIIRSGEPIFPLKTSQNLNRSCEPRPLLHLKPRCVWIKFTLIFFRGKKQKLLLLSRSCWTSQSNTSRYLDMQSWDGVTISSEWREIPWLLHTVCVTPVTSWERPDTTEWRCEMVWCCRGKRCNKWQVVIQTSRSSVLDGAFLQNLFFKKHWIVGEIGRGQTRWMDRSINGWILTVKSLRMEKHGKMDGWMLNKHMYR